MKHAANDREHEHKKKCHLHLGKKSFSLQKSSRRRLSENKEKMMMMTMMKKTLWIWDTRFKIKCFISIRHNCAICKLTRGWEIKWQLLWT